MQRLRRFLFSIALLVSLFGMTAFVGVSTVSAHAVQRSSPQVTCSGNGCNGKDPVATGCASGAYTVQTAVFSNSNVELRYSPTCKTNWGLVTSKVSATVLVIRIQRIDGLTYTFSGGNFTSARSAMVYAPVLKARACGGVKVIRGCTAYV